MSKNLELIILAAFKVAVGGWVQNLEMGNFFWPASLACAQ